MLVVSRLTVSAAPPVANPSIAAPQPAATPATPPVVADPPRPRLRTIHRQVSRLPLDREYRSVPVGDAVTVAAHGKIEAALARAVDKDVDFVETPLRDVVNQWRDTLGIPVVLDVRALENSGIDLETPITFAGQGRSVRAMLRQVLGHLDLTWMIRDEALVITTTERAAVELDLRLYPLPWGYRTLGQVDFQTLIDLIQNTAGGPGTWADDGGNGGIRPLGDGAAAVLVVAQTAEVHDEIEGLLRGLHERALAEFGGPDDLPASKTPTVRVHHVADQVVRRDLAQKLVELCNTSLPHGADPQAKVTVVGDCLAVQSLTPEFHALAGHLIQAVAGEQVLDTDGTSHPAGGGMPAGGAF
jgi:hypothetical protein